MALGDTVAVFDALATRSTGGSHATLDLRGGHPVLDFDDDADEAAYFSGVLPAVYAGGDLNISLMFIAASATMGSVVWEVAFERHQPGATELESTTFGAGQAVSTSVAAVAGTLTQATILLPASSLSGALRGESFRLRVVRLATQAADDATGDAELHSVEIREA